MRFSWLNLHQLDFLSLFSYFWLGTSSRCYRNGIQVSFRRSLILLLWWRSSFQSREDFYNVPIQDFVTLEWFLYAYLLALAVDQGWVVWDCEVLSYKRLQYLRFIYLVGLAVVYPPRFHFDYDLYHMIVQFFGFTFLSHLLSPLELQLCLVFILLGLPGGFSSTVTLS